MKKSFCRPTWIVVVTLAACLLVAALLTTTRSAGVTLALAPTAANDTPSEQEPRLLSPASELLVPKSTAAYNGVITPATTVYAPWLSKGTSSLRVYNAGDGPATVWVAFTDSEGETIIQESSLEAGAVGDISPSVAVLTGTEMSAILTGTQPIVAVLNNFGLDRKQASSYAAVPAGVGQTRLELPFVIYDNRGWNSKPVIQNVGVTTASVAITYTDPNTHQSWQDSRDLAPKQTFAFDLHNAGLPSLFEGVATVSSEQPLIAIVNSIESLYPNNAYIYRVPFPPAENGDGRSLYFPILVNDFQNWDRSLIWLMNAEPTTVTFDLEVDGAPYQVNASIHPWGTKGYSQDDRPSDWLGNGLVPDAQSLYSLVWLVGDFTGDSAAAYSAFNRGARTWYLPYADEGDLLSTYVAVQNLSDITVHITRTYHAVDGASAPITGETIPPSRMAYYTAPGGSFVGGVVIQADQPVSAVAFIAGRLALDKKVYIPVMMRDG